jgi:hypothetical protein
MPSRSRARGREQVGSPADDVIHVDEPGLNPRHDGPEPALALEDRPITEILPVIASTSKATKYRQSRRDNSVSNSERPSGARHTISPSSTAVCARIAWAISTCSWGNWL